ncbi:MAG: MFS transporter [Spirochaetaceae bacterium]|nr:MFS transporter [Spirochaetaceae bacterium]
MKTDTGASTDAALQEQEQPKQTDLTPRQIRTAQRRFTLFSFVNMVSWQLLTGNIITLYALRLGADDLTVGVLYSLIPLGQLLPLAGRIIVRHVGSVRTMAVFMALRNLLMLPIMAAPLFANAGRADIGVWLIIASVIGFNLARGIAITGNNAIIGAITTDADRGSFLSQQQVVTQLAAIGTGVAMGLLLQDQAPLLLYSLLFAAGIATGLATASIVSRLPEPPTIARGGGFVRSVIGSLRHRNTQRFTLLLAVHSFVVSMALPFLIVYVKRAHEQSDSVAMLLTVIGSLGAVGVALLSGLVVDRVGARPLMSVYTGILSVTLVLVVAAPPLATPLGVWLYLGSIFFLATFAANGIASAHSIYFFALVPAAERLNMGVFNFLVTGIPASLGAMTGGALLSLLATMEFPDPSSLYRIYFGGIVAAYLGISMLTSAVDRLGAATVPDVLGILVSPRDLGEMSLLHRLKASQTADTELSLVEHLGQIQARHAVPDMLRTLRSPRFAVRAETLDTLTDATLTADLERALIAEVDSQPYTTAYLAAEIIGRKQVHDGIPALRRGLSSDDFFLAGKCMVALGRLGDRDSLRTIGNLFRNTGNPYLLIHGAAALELLGDPQSLPILLTALEQDPIAPVRDEVILASAGILETADTFYAQYRDFLAEATQGLAMLADFVAENQERHPLPGPTTEQLTTLLDLIDDSAFAEHAASALARIPVVVQRTDVTPALAAATRHPSTGRSPQFRFFLAAVLAVYAWRMRIAVKSL